MSYIQNQTILYINRYDQSSDSKILYLMGLKSSSSEDILNDVKNFKHILYSYHNEILFNDKLLNIRKQWIMQ